MILIRNLLLICILSGVVSCGTARGVLYGTGAVLEGVAMDAQSVGNWIK